MTKQHSEIVQKCLSKDIEERRAGHVLLRQAPPHTQTAYAQEVRTALSGFDNDANEDDLWEISELLYCMGYITAKTEVPANKNVLKQWIEKAEWVETVAQALCAMVHIARPDDLEWFIAQRKRIGSGIDLKVSEEYPDPDCRLPTYIDFIILKVRAAHGAFDQDTAIARTETSVRRN